MKIWHYYEAHITVVSTPGLDIKVLRDICKDNKFKLSDFTNIIKDEDDAPTELICTARDKILMSIQTRQNAMLRALKESGIKVSRNKLEYTLCDSKYEENPNV